MWTKCVLLLLLVVLWIAADWPIWRRKGGKTTALSWLLFTPALYFGVVYLWQPTWPGYGELLEWIYGGPADLLDSWIKAA